MTQNTLILGARVGFPRADARRFGVDGYGVHLVAQFIAWVSERMSSYRRPSAVTFIDTIRRMGSGKFLCQRPAIVGRARAAMRVDWVATS